MKMYYLSLALLAALAPAYGAGPQTPRAFKQYQAQSQAPESLAMPESSPEAEVDADVLVSPEPADELLTMNLAGGDKDHPNDPGYKTYKEGYNLILDEEWKSARKKFSELIGKYPKSDYVDDAAYWSAYAEKNIDRKKAIAEYKTFISKYPKSAYFDDAVADLSQLSGKHSITLPYIYNYSNDSNAVSSGSGSGKGYSYSWSTNMDAAMRRLQRQMAHVPHAIHIPNVHIPAMPNVAIAPRVYRFYGENDEKLDDNTRLKMDALSALGDTREDSTSFRTLRDVAVDTKQPRELRMTALDALSNFKKFDVLPVFIEVAKNDTDSEIQNSAIDVISNLSGQKNRSVDALIDLFNTLPKSRKDQRETIFYTIADIGNDKAVDFLAQVAKSSDNYELRSQAIYYLGNIGGEKARAALYDILRQN